MKSFRDILNEEIIQGDPDEMALPYADTLAQNVNVREIPSGSNRSPEIDRYFDIVGLNNRNKGNDGYPWCMAFVYAMFNDFTKKLGLKNPLVKTAGVMKHWNKADSSLKIPVSNARKNPSLVKPGQVFIQSRKGGGHTGIVTSVNTKNGTFTTIEGNTNDKLSGEGHRVGRNTRKLSQSSLIGFIDYFKGNRSEKFEKTISEVVAKAPTSYSTEEYVDGLSKSDIKDIQTFLKGLGYDLGDFGPNKDGVDGEIGDKTTAAINHWKSKNGMKPDSVIDKSLYQKMVKSKKSGSPSSSLDRLIGTGSTQAPKKKSFIGKVLRAAMPSMFPNKLVTIDPTNTSKDSNYIIKRAVVESTNSASALSDMLNEQSVFNKIRDFKRSSDTRLADIYRGKTTTESPIDNTGNQNVDIKPESDGKTIVQSKPEIDIIYNKKDDSFHLKAVNTAAKNIIGSDDIVKIDPKDLEEIQLAFKDPSTVKSTSTNPVTVSDKDFYESILKGVGAPITSENMKFLQAWRQAEGGKATYNPFNTTKKMSKDSGMTNYNSAGVKNYSTPQLGIQATVDTLKLGYYTNIINDLKSDAGAEQIASNIDQLKTWGTGGLIAKVLSKGNVNPPKIATA